jgi:hypothetical protein
LSTKAIGLDIDEPADLAQLMTQLHFEKKSHTAQLLLGTVVGKRVEVLDAHNNPQISTSDETRI